MAEERHQRTTDEDRGRGKAPTRNSDGRAQAPSLELQYELTGVLSRALSVPEMAPALLHLLVQGLGLGAAELCVEVRDGCVSAHAGSWIEPCVRGAERQGGAPRVRAEGVVRDAPLRGSANDDSHDRLFCVYEQSSTTGGQGGVILRAYSSAQRPLDLDTQHFLHSVARQIEQFVTACTQSDWCSVMAARQAALIDAARDAAFTIDARGRVLTINATAEALLGLTPSVLGSDLVDLIIAPEQREGVRVAFDYFRATRECDSRGRRIEARAKRGDCTEFAATLTLIRTDSEKELAVLVLVTDDSRRTLDERRVLAYQERLRSLTADLLLADERARRQLALDLHDGLSQLIALIRIRVTLLRSGAQGAQAMAWDELVDLIDQASQSVRSATFELSPPVLHDLGLEPALEWLVENIGSRYGLDVVFEHDDRAKPMDEKTRIILFRSIRELLINAAKHAEADVVTVSLERIGDEIEASVEDDGVGMTRGLDEVEGFGLFSIQERLRHVGGDIAILSELGRGTSVRLRAPTNDGCSPLLPGEYGMRTPARGPELPDGHNEMIDNSHGEGS